MSRGCRVSRASLDFLHSKIGANLWFGCTESAADIKVGSLAVLFYDLFALFVDSETPGNENVYRRKHDIRTTQTENSVSVRSVRIGEYNQSTLSCFVYVRIRTSVIRFRNVRLLSRGFLSG